MFVDPLLIVAHVICGGFVFGPCFVIQYFVSFLCCNHLYWEKEIWLLYFNCVPDVLWLLVFCRASSRYHVLVCSV